MENILQESLAVFIYSIEGIILAFVAFKVVDILTPGNLREQLTHKDNIPLAIFASAMVLGVCLIIASVMIS